MVLASHYISIRTETYGARSHIFDRTVLSLRHSRRIREALESVRPQLDKRKHDRLSLRIFWDWVRDGQMSQYKPMKSVEHYLLNEGLYKRTTVFTESAKSSISETAIPWPDTRVLMSLNPASKFTCSCVCCLVAGIFQNLNTRTTSEFFLDFTEGTPCLNECR